MKQLENREILSDDIFAAIELIINSCPSVVFGGSIALNAIGVISRKISDIDLFFSLNASLSKVGFLQVENDGEIISDTVTNTNGKEIQRTGAKILGVKTCCFKVENEELSHSLHAFRRGEKEITICIQNINYAIEAKRAYSSKNAKHKQDLLEIDNFLEGLILD